MPRVCLVCSSPKRAEVDSAIVAGETKAGIARRLRVSPDSVDRHAKEHLSTAIVKAHEAHEAARGDDLLGQIRDLQTRTLALLKGAEEAGDVRAAVAAVHQGRENLALLTRLLSELKSGSAVDVGEELGRVRDELLSALAPFPDARRAAAEALDRVASGA